MSKGYSTYPAYTVNTLKEEKKTVNDNLWIIIDRLMKIAYILATHEMTPLEKYA